MKKRILLGLILVLTAVSQMFAFCGSANAMKSSAKLDQTQIETLQKNISSLTKKINTSSLFSSEDIDKLVEIREQLNSIADTNLKDMMYARLFYDAAFIFKERDYKQDAIQYFSVVTKNFPETIYSKRALSELKKFGIDIDKNKDKTDK